MQVLQATMSVLLSVLGSEIERETIFIFPRRDQHICIHHTGALVSPCHGTLDESRFDSASCYLYSVISILSAMLRTDTEPCIMCTYARPGRE